MHTTKILYLTYHTTNFSDIAEAIIVVGNGDGEDEGPVGATLDLGRVYQGPQSDSDGTGGAVQHSIPHNKLEKIPKQKRLNFQHIKLRSNIV